MSEVFEAQHCRMVSLNDVQTPTGWTTIQVIWALSVTEDRDGCCTFANLVVSYLTKDFLDLLARTGQRFEAAATARQAATSEHNRRETETLCGQHRQGPRVVTHKDVDPSVEGVGAVLLVLHVLVRGQIASSWSSVSYETPSHSGRGARAVVEAVNGGRSRLPVAEHHCG